MNIAIQGTPEWREDKLGKVGASRVADIIARTKTGYSASRANYAAELIAERLTGYPAERFVSAPMQHGIDTEAEARTAYEFRTSHPVVQVGFIPHPTIDMAGASPDGLVGEDGLVEIKCPNTATHLDALLNGVLPSKYETQMQWQMACTGRAWCDFASYDPRLPESMRLYLVREPRNVAKIEELEREVLAFLQEIDGKIASLRSRFMPASNLLLAG
jgi:putative phage-type endonuclease